MTWSNVPLTAPALATKAAMDEVKAAFDERYDAVGASFGKPNAVTAGDLMDWSATIAHYHTKIESLLGSFYQKSGSGESTTFAAYTKSSLLTECFCGRCWISWNGYSSLLILQVANAIASIWTLT